MRTMYFESYIAMPEWTFTRHHVLEISGSTKDEILAELAKQVARLKEAGYIITRDFIAVSSHNRMSDWSEIFGCDGMTPQMFGDHWQPGGAGNPFPVSLAARIKRGIQAGVRGLLHISSTRHELADSNK